MPEFRVRLEWVSLLNLGSLKVNSGHLESILGRRQPILGLSKSSLGRRESVLSHVSRFERFGRRILALVVKFRLLEVKFVLLELVIRPVRFELRTLGVN